jgi:oligo-1,6-glucosidase
MVFQFEHMQIDADPRTNIPKDWTLRELKEIMTRWQVNLQGRGWNSLYLNNHDFPRSVSRFGDEGRYRVASAKMLATFNHLLQGTPFIYQGEEIGMTNVAFESIEDYRDISTINAYRELIAAGVDRDLIMWGVHRRSRDNARTPMQWSDSPNAGFTKGEPWIKVNPNYEKINVAAALDDPDSIFYYYQKLIRLRRENPVMVYGLYELILPEHEKIFAFTRTLEEERLLVMLNFSAGEARFTLPAELPANEAELMIANYAVDEIETVEQVVLRPFEARVYRLEETDRGGN